MSYSCDTSVLVAALAPWHSAHAISRTALARVEALPAQVLLECYSVLTRLPAPHRVRPGDAAAVITALPFPTIILDAAGHHTLPARLADQDIRGGATYDGLVAATSLEHGLTLITRDRRAIAIYDAVGAAVEVLPED